MTTNGRGRRGQLRADFCDALCRKRLGLGMRKREGALVLGPRLVGPAEAAEQVGTRRVEVLVAVETEPIDEGEPRFGSIRLGDGDRAVQLPDRRAG
jgi:hypothetical protein